MDALKEIVDYGIIGLLFVLSVWAMAVAFERWQFYRRIDLSHYPRPADSAESCGAGAC